MSRLSITHVLFPLCLAVHLFAGTVHAAASRAPAPAPAPAPGPAASAGSGKVLRNVLLTFYGYDDNDDGMGHFGNDVISDPQIHARATEDLGTYDHPSTFATDYRVAKAGTLIYIPKVHKYFIMEDTCVECSADARRGRKRIDLYIGDQKMQGRRLINCEDALTGDGYHDVVVVNPGPNLPVESAPLFHSGKCDPTLYPTP